MKTCLKIDVNPCPLTCILNVKSVIVLPKIVQTIIALPFLSAKRIILMNWKQHKSNCLSKDWHKDVMVLLSMEEAALSGMSDRGTNRQTRFRKYNRGFITVVRSRGQTGVVTRQTGTVRIVQVRGREAGVGQIRADEGVVPDGRQSRGREQTWVGAGQTKTETGIQDRCRL